MLQSEHGLLEPGMRVRVCSQLKGQELYAIDDPVEYKHFCGQEVTVRKVEKGRYWMVFIEEHEKACFLMEEIECILDSVEMPESEESLSVLLGGAV